MTAAVVALVAAAALAGAGFAVLGFTLGARMALAGGPQRCARCRVRNAFLLSEQPGVWLRQPLCAECELKAELDAGRGRTP